MTREQLNAKYPGWDWKNTSSDTKWFRGMRALTGAKSDFAWIDLCGPEPMVSRGDGVGPEFDGAWFQLKFWNGE